MGGVELEGLSITEFMDDFYIIFYLTYDGSIVKLILARMANNTANKYGVCNIFFFKEYFRILFYKLVRSLQ
jgi:hypothetical protein